MVKTIERQVNQKSIYLSRLQSHNLINIQELNLHHSRIRLPVRVPRRPHDVSIVALNFSNGTQTHTGQETLNTGIRTDRNAVVYCNGLSFVLIARTCRIKEDFFKPDWIIHQHLFNAEVDNDFFLS